jgi:AcrR family transcriptional regulator
MRGTKQKILDTAERLFAKQGFSATSIRQITSIAGVNVASIHYHFGSKDHVVSAIFSRRLSPLNRARLERLEEHKKNSKAGHPSLNQTIEAFIGPPLRLGLRSGKGERQFMQLMGRAFTEPGHYWEELIMPQFKDIAAVFFPALRVHLPNLSEEDFFWRIVFMIGTMSHTMSAAPRLDFLSQGKCDSGDPEGTIQKMTTFLVGGFCAPSNGYL